MFTVLLSIHVVVCILVVLIVLVQAGRSGGLSGLMGASSGDAVFSTSSQQSGLRKITFILAGIFMLTSFGLTILSSRQRRISVFQQQFPSLPPVAGSAPEAAPAPAPANGPGAPAVPATIPKK